MCFNYYYCDKYVSFLPTTKKFKNNFQNVVPMTFDYLVNMMNYTTERMKGRIKKKNGVT